MNVRFLIAVLLLNFSVVQGSKIGFEEEFEKKCSEKSSVHRSVQTNSGNPDSDLEAEELYNFVKNDAHTRIYKLKHAYGLNNVVRGADLKYLETLETQLISAADRETKLSAIRSVANSLKERRWNPASHVDSSNDDLCVYSEILDEVTPRRCCCFFIDQTINLTIRDLNDSIGSLLMKIHDKKNTIQRMELQELRSLHRRGINIDVLLSSLGAESIVRAMDEHKSDN